MRKRIYILIIVQYLLFGSAFAEGLTLDSCLQMARRNNPEMRKAELGIRRAEEVKAQAFTNYFPKVQGTAFGFHALHPMIEVGINDIDNASVRDLLTTLYGNYGAALGLDNTLSLFGYGYFAGVTALQPVFAGGKIVAGNKLAKVGVEAAKLQAEIAEREELEQVEQSYWLVYGLEQKDAIITDAQALLDTLYKAVHSAVEAGLALPSDLTKVEMQRDEIQRRHLQLQSGKRLARRALALSIGMEGDGWQLAQQNVETDTLLLPDTTVTTKEQQLLSLQVRAAELEKRMVLADALPQLAVGANYSYGRLQTNLLRDGLGNKNGNGALFVTLNVPLTGWWETSHKLREKQYAIEQAKIDADYLGAQLDLRTKQAYDKMMEAAAMMLLQERTQVHAEEAYEQASVNYEAGMATIAELLQAQTALTQAKANLTDAQIAYRVHTKRYRDLIAH
ncbi:MAG: TolC family protein [Paludibacteraceae bacterium]|nr:TolC family protein [Paludibacteraceae bacterium]